MVDNASTLVFSSNMTVTRMVVAKNPEHQVPDAATLVLADFSGKVQHPSEAVSVESFGFPSYFCRASACHTLQIITCHTVF